LRERLQRLLFCKAKKFERKARRGRFTCRGTPKHAGKNHQAKNIRQKTSGKKHQAKNKVLSICEKFRGTAFFNHTTPATPTF
jgi:hypothetical protein